MLDTIEADWDRVRQTASDHGRDASALKLGINRITILEDGGLEAAAERLGEMREIGFDHAIANLHPGAANPEALLQEFAATHLGRSAGRLGARIQSSHCSLAWTPRLFKVRPVRLAWTPMPVQSSPHSLEWMPKLFKVRPHSLEWMPKAVQSSTRSLGWMPRLFKVRPVRLGGCRGYSKFDPFAWVDAAAIQSSPRSLEWMTILFKVRAVRLNTAACCSNLSVKVE